MENSQTQIPSISLILKKIADDKTLTLFNTIAIADGDKYIPLKEMNLTTKQYYARISGLLNAGLIKRHKGKYSLTLLGNIVYDAHLIIGKALNYYWKLNAIESIEASSNGLPKQEILKLVDALIDNHQVKEVITKALIAPERNFSVEPQEKQQRKKELEERNLISF